MSNSRGDFKLVKSPDRQPAVDFITRSAEGPFVDTGVDIRLRSQPGMPVVVERLYLSVSTVRFLSEVAGLSFGESDQDREDVASYEARLIAQGKLDGLREGIGDDLANVARTLREWLDAAGVPAGRAARS